ncbi:MAG: 3-hydroxyacyl-CoA dehydrogenase [Fulvimarina manganoxydans]|uniref:3-hydroxyacyl-CoA dehydrogenase/enoyl-CoA hydratase family protein n=1 Tax=Fulvimarina manganoxydans TaxID=937218 RepID=UPI0023545CAB|nr:3-hydroxyacyl-CoA dehydrogenase/enoyl-CoA hydratase family protein [Fulvimarina manganoxydans]MCK5933643.1 3-hydroxyacyl-CoA dehydrogenase [Fulvimarina manganoxydans]
MTTIETAAVIGAGVMGATIAAQIANSGTKVLLLDIVPKDAKSRNALAEGAIQRMLKASPAPFMHKKAARLIEAGNLEDDLERLADVDWIVEAVIERLDIKQDLYRRIESVRKTGSIVSSNTSTIPLATLLEGLPEGFSNDFLITHFFNPPRYMRLLEVVSSGATRAEAVKAVSEFADRRLGKTVVTAKDTPSFIANRLGVFWLQTAAIEAAERGIAVEAADQVIGRPFGFPKTGVFGLLDLVGLDLMPHINASLSKALPEDDPYQNSNRDFPILKQLIAEGYTGRKGKGGFYRVNREGGQTQKEAVDLRTGKFSPVTKPKLAAIIEAGSSPRALLEHDSEAGRYAAAVMVPTLSYAARLVGDAADTIADIDEAMRLGYSWQQGPFELIDAIGPAWLAERLEAANEPVPPILQAARNASFYKTEGGELKQLGLDGAYHPVVRPEGVLLLSDVKRSGSPLLANESARLWDVGDGIACFEFTSKANSIDDKLLMLLDEALSLVEANYTALVIHNEGTNFSVGANLGLVAEALKSGGHEEIGKITALGQQIFGRLRTAPFPVVGAPSGMAVGGGCEILLHCDAVQAHAETYIGLVEAGVGLIPGWGGCAEMLHRWQTIGRLPKGPMPASARAFELISVATVAKSAAEAKDHLFLRPHDRITMNKDRLLADAKERALELAKDYTPPKGREYRLAGPSGRAALDLAVQQVRHQGKATPHDVVVSGKLAEVLTGGDADPLDTLTDDMILELERECFADLLRTSATVERIEAMMKTGKPLRN